MPQSGRRPQHHQRTLVDVRGTSATPAGRKNCSEDYERSNAGAPERLLLDQPQALEARVPVLAHDNVVMHGNAQRMGDGDDLLRHLDVGAGRRRIARGVVVQQAV
jgi:hypothetical protein